MLQSAEVCTKHNILIRRLCIMLWRISTNRNGYPNIPLDLVRSQYTTTSAKHFSLLFFFFGSILRVFSYDRALSLLRIDKYGGRHRSGRHQSIKVSEPFLYLFVYMGYWIYVYMCILMPDAIPFRSSDWRCAICGRLQAFCAFALCHTKFVIQT